MKFNLGWKTLLGAALYVVGQIAGPDVAAVATDTVGNGVSAVGAGLAAVGLRHAIAKAK